MQKTERLEFLNGIKVIGFFMVFHLHFFNAFYPGIYSLNPADFNTSNQFEYIVGTSPLNLLLAGKFSVRVFLVMSGFLAARRFFITGEERALAEGAVKKYFRLVLPILAVNILVAILMYAGLYQNHNMAVYANSVDAFGNYNNFPPSFFGAVKEAVWGCFINGANAYNGPIWFIMYEFLGTLMVTAILSLFGKRKARFVVYAVVCIAFIRTDFLAIFLGMIICELLYHNYQWIEKIRSRKWLMRLLLIGGLLVASYPAIGEYGNRLSGTVYGLFPAKVMIYYVFAGAGIFFAICSLSSVQKVLSGQCFAWFSKISYCFYLVHFPILCTATSAFFLLLKDKCNYHVLAALLYLFTVLLSVAVSWVLHRFVEKPGMKWAEKIADQLLT